MSTLVFTPLELIETTVLQVSPCKVLTIVAAEEHDCENVETVTIAPLLQTTHELALLDNLSSVPVVRVSQVYIFRNSTT